jgi:phosphate starvation-inducible PhoH-like protein
MSQRKQHPRVAPDTSPQVHQKPILKNSVELRQLPWTEKQLDLLALAADKQTQLILVRGVAGTSKTATAVFSVLKALNDKKVSDIVLVRSVVESSDNKMGYLPGSADDKIRPYLIPFFDKLEMFLSPQALKNLQEEGRINAFPFSFLRGMDWNRKAIILDEAQNTSRKELLTFMTRIGRFGKTFIIGDPSQSDIKNSGFDEVFELFNNEEAKYQGIHTFEFQEEDVMRSELCKYISRRFKDLPVKPIK